MRVFRVVLLVLMIAGIAAGAIVQSSQPAESQEAGEMLGAGGEFGIGGVGSMGTFTPTDAWLLDVTPMGLADIDPLSGGIIDSYVDIPDSFSYAATNELMATNQLALDAAEMVRRAQEILEQKRKEEARKKGVAVKRISGYGYPEDWEMMNFSECGVASNSRYRDRVEVVLAFEAMCQDALADGVHLGIVYGYRSIEKQTELWNARVSREMAAGKTRSEAEAAARKWVAPPGRSQHNRGLAIDLNTSTDPAVMEWVHTPVGCYKPPDNLRLGVTSCASDEEVVDRVQLYGFILPLDHEPWHIELGITLAANLGNGDGTVLAVGDSIMVGATEELKSELGSVDIYAEVSRNVAPGIDVLRSQLNVSDPRAVIVELGTNNGMSAEQFDTIMALVDGRPTIFVNVKAARDWETPTNQVLADGAARYTNATVVDWKGLADQHPEWFGSDGIHPNGSGQTALAKLIASAVPSRGVGGDCSPSESMAVPEIISAVWRCRLSEAGYSQADQDRIVAEAVVVSKCESGWNPTAIAYGGRYLHERHPTTGYYYSARGVFQFIKTSAERWIPGGWEAADDPVLNIDGAARYYLWEREQGREGWEPWSCRNTYLPQYGGRSLPDWAYQY